MSIPCAGSARGSRTRFASLPPSPTASTVLGGAWWLVRARVECQGHPPARIDRHVGSTSATHIFHFQSRVPTSRAATTLYEASSQARWTSQFTVGMPASADRSTDPAGCSPSRSAIGRTSDAPSPPRTGNPAGLLPPPWSRTLSPGPTREGIWHSRSRTPSIDSDSKEPSPVRHGRSRPAAQEPDAPSLHLRREGARCDLFVAAKPPLRARHPATSADFCSTTRPADTTASPQPPTTGRDSVSPVIERRSPQGAPAVLTSSRSHASSLAPIRRAEHPWSPVRPGIRRGSVGPMTVRSRPPLPPSPRRERFRQRVGCLPPSSRRALPQEPRGAVPMRARRTGHRGHLFHRQPAGPVDA